MRLDELHGYRSFVSKSLDEGQRDPQLNHVYSEEFIYHVTKLSNFAKIAQYGLVSKHESTFQDYDANNDRIHWSPTLDSFEYWAGMLNFQFTKSIHDFSKTLIIRIKRDKLQLIKSYRSDEVLSDDVSPENLEYIIGKDLVGVNWQKLIA